MNDFHDAKAYLQKKIGDGNDPQGALFNDMVSFMQAISRNDYAAAEHSIQRIARESQGDLYQEVGKVTRKLHDAICSFRDSIDPKMREFATSEVPNAVDKLQGVITRTEEAANKTMSVVDKYFSTMDTLKEHVERVQGPPETRDYLRQFRSQLEEDMTVILTTQSFQDLTGQTIRKVIKLVGDIEGELVKLITTFGVREEPEEPAPLSVDAEETVSQADVDDLLKNFGF